MANYTSDLNLTMAASELFESIIDQVRSSNLNFQIQMTPFSANIVIKKTFIKDNSGFPLLPPTYKNHNHDQEIGEQDQLKKAKENYEIVTAELKTLKADLESAT